MGFPLNLNSPVVSVPVMEEKENHRGDNPRRGSNESYGHNGSVLLPAQLSRPLLFKPRPRKDASPFLLTDELTGRAVCWNWTEPQISIAWALPVENSSATH